MNAGVLAFGDSITNGGGELQWGVALQSWALWTARGLGLPFTGYAVDGARMDHVAQRAGPGVQQRTALDRRALRRRLPVRGVNDVRALDWDAGASRATTRRRSTFLAERCERVLLVTIPERLGRPRAGGVARRTR